MGYRVLVRMPAHPQVWRILIERALRAEHSLEDVEDVLGSPVSVTAGRARQPGTLLDVSNRGCRLSSPLEFRAGVSCRLFAVQSRAEYDCEA